MSHHRGYKIERVCGPEELWYVSKDGKDLFFGFKSLNEAKTKMDGWISFLSTAK